MSLREKLTRVFKAIAHSFSHSSKRDRKAVNAADHHSLPSAHANPTSADGLLLYPVRVLNKITFLLSAAECVRLLLIGNHGLLDLLDTGGLSSVYVDDWDFDLSRAHAPLDRRLTEKMLVSSLRPADYLLRVLGSRIRAYHVATCPMSPRSLMTVAAVTHAKYYKQFEKCAFYFSLQHFSKLPSTLLTLYIGCFPFEAVVEILLAKDEQESSDNVPSRRLSPSLADLFPHLRSLSIDVRNQEWHYSGSELVRWQKEKRCTYSLELPQTLTTVSIPLMCSHPSFSATLEGMTNLISLHLYVSPLMECWDTPPAAWKRSLAMSGRSTSSAGSSSDSSLGTHDTLENDSPSDAEYFSASSSPESPGEHELSWDTIFASLPRLRHFGVGVYEHKAQTTIEILQGLDYASQCLRHLSIDAAYLCADWLNILPETLVSLSGTIRARPPCGYRASFDRPFVVPNAMNNAVVWPPHLTSVRFELDYLPRSVERLLGRHWAKALPEKLRVFSLIPSFPNAKFARLLTLSDTIIRQLPTSIETFELPAKVLWSLGGSHLPDGRLLPDMAQAISHLTCLACDEIYGTSTAKLTNMQYLSVGNAIGWAPQHLWPLRHLRVLVILNLQKSNSRHKKRLFSDRLMQSLPETLEILVAPDLTGSHLPRHIKCLYLFKSKHFDVNFLREFQTPLKIALLDLRRRKRSFSSTSFSVLPATLKVFRVRSLDIRRMEDFETLPKGLVELYFDLWKHCELRVYFSSGSSDTHPIRFYKLKPNSILLNLQSYRGEYWYILPPETNFEGFPELFRNGMWTQHGGTFVDREIDLIIRQSMSVPWYNAPQSRPNCIF